MISPNNVGFIYANSDCLSDMTTEQCTSPVDRPENGNIFKRNLASTITEREFSHIYYPVTSVSPDGSHYSTPTSYSSDEYQYSTSSATDEMYPTTSLSNESRNRTSPEQDWRHFVSSSQIDLSSPASLPTCNDVTTSGGYEIPSSKRKIGIKQTKESSKTTERRNARERKRIGHLKTHFENLQTRLPDDWKSTKMSKLDILTKSIRYIRHLENILAGGSQHQELDLWALCSPVLHVSNPQNGGTQTTRTVTYQLSKDDFEMASPKTTTDCFRLDRSSKKSERLSDDGDSEEIGDCSTSVQNFCPDNEG